MQMGTTDYEPLIYARCWSIRWGSTIVVDFVVSSSQGSGINDVLTYESRGVEDTRAGTYLHC